MEKSTRRIQIFVHALIISGALNLALIAIFITFVLKERSEVPLPQAELHPPLQHIALSNKEILYQYFSYSFEELVKELYDVSLVEYGYRRCDLALSCLAALHYFDVKRALAGFPLEKRQLVLAWPEGGGEEVALILYPGMNEDQFNAIRLFSHTELWPLTPFGLYREICIRECPPQSLKEALMMTTEVHTLKRKLCTLPISDDDIIDLLKFSEWTHIENFTTLPNFLMSCIQKDSKLAAHLLVLLERDYAFIHLDNRQMEKLLTLLTEKTPEIESFLEEVAKSIRPESVRNLSTTFPQKLERSHIVQKGDSLWKISREYNVKIEDLRKINALQSDHLHPGTKLILPEKP